MSDACTKQVIGKNKSRKLSVDMLAYVMAHWLVSDGASQPVQNQHLAGIDPP
jgi:hypothetical protein